VHRDSIADQNLLKANDANVKELTIRLQDELDIVHILRAKKNAHGGGAGLTLPIPTATKDLEYVL
jgi:hypothetical protein